MTRSQATPASSQIIALEGMVQRLEQRVVAQQARIQELREALRATTEGLEWRWESIANRAAPIHESAIDEAHTKGIEALMVKDDLSALNDLKARYEARIAELRGALEVASDMATQAMSGYGFYRPEDPHNFFPDLSMCSPEEIAAHSAACEAYDRREKIADGTWGIGTYTDSIPQVDAALAKKDDLSALEAVKSQARREALMEAADYVFDLDVGTSLFAIQTQLRRMAGEVKP